MYVDSNIFVFAALDTDKRGENARKIIERAEEGRITIYISPLIFDDVLHVTQKLNISFSSFLLYCTIYLLNTSFKNLRYK